MALPIDQQPSQVGTYEKILTIANRIMNGGEITKEEAIELIHTSDDDTMILLAMADKIRQHFNDNSVDVCAIVNARSGKCPENCKFCAQSAHHNTGVMVITVLPSPCRLRMILSRLISPILSCPAVGSSKI